MKILNKGRRLVKHAKALKMLVWLTQLGLNVALPPLGFVLLSLWLHRQLSWGVWVIWVGIGLGLFYAIDGLRRSLKQMEQMSDADTPKEKPVSFNQHD